MCRADGPGVPCQKKTEMQQKREAIRTINPTMLAIHQEDPSEIIISGIDSVRSLWDWVDRPRPSGSAT